MAPLRATEAVVALTSDHTGQAPSLTSCLDWLSGPSAALPKASSSSTDVTVVVDLCGGEDEGAQGKEEEAVVEALMEMGVKRKDARAAYAALRKGKKEGKEEGPSIHACLDWILVRPAEEKEVRTKSPWEVPVCEAFYSHPSHLD